ncbi:equilibrative nucleobase transporter 1-like [Babylonia areolata]|uniref:equilibrative nucleobase transporter 1-like n=1 Tax=Babylonia areolata TaxID=304850 RepID=UPI003FD611D9
MAANPQFRFFYVIWAFLENVFFGGLLYGWGSLVFVLKEDRVFSEICDDFGAPRNIVDAPKNISFLNQNTELAESSTMVAYLELANTSHSPVSVVNKQNLNCPDRDKRLTLLFTIGSMLYCVGCAVIGQINFKFGTRITRLFGLVSFIAGSLLVGFTTHDCPWLFFPGLVLLGSGGAILLVTNMQFSMLFTEGSSTVVSVLSGAFDGSSGVMLIVKLAHEAGIALRWSMMFLAGFYTVTLVSTFLFLPRGFIPKALPQPIRDLDLEMDVELLEKNKTHLDDGTKNAVNTETETLKEKGQMQKKELPSLVSCIVSPVYWLHVVWLSILQLRFYYFLGSLNTWLTELLSTKEEVSYYTNVCLYAMMCGVVTSPVSGVVYDIFKRIFANSRSKMRRDLMPSVVPLALTSVLGIVVSLLVLLNKESVLYPLFVLNTCFRSFIYAMAAAYIGVMFPSEYFGILYGLTIILGGIISLAQYGFFEWQEATGVLSVNGFLIAFMALSLVHPVYQWICCRRAESRVVTEE